MLDTWVDNTSMGRTNLPPGKVPWKAMKTLLSQCIYGGKIDNEFDQKLLDAFLSKLFNEKCFDTDYNLVGGAANGANQLQIHIPDCVRRDQFLAWIEQLAEKQSPEWLGLPHNAETVLLTNQVIGAIQSRYQTKLAWVWFWCNFFVVLQGKDSVMKLLKMQQLDDDDEELAYSTTTGKGGAGKITDVT